MLFLLVLEAYFEVVNPGNGLPLIGHWVGYGLVTEIIARAGHRRHRGADRDPAAQPPGAGRLSRFTGSTMWQGYFVEAVIVGVLLCGFADPRVQGRRPGTSSSRCGPLRSATRSARCCRPGADGATVAALVKIVISMTWLIVIALNVTMGVAWHRFLAFPNIFFKRDPASRPARPWARCGR